MMFDTHPSFGPQESISGVRSATTFESIADSFGRHFMVENPTRSIAGIRAMEAAENQFNSSTPGSLEWLMAGYAMNGILPNVPIEAREGFSSPIGELSKYDNAGEIAFSAYAEIGNKFVDMIQPDMVDGLLKAKTDIALMHNRIVKKQQEIILRVVRRSQQDGESIAKDIESIWNFRSRIQGGTEQSRKQLDDKMTAQVAELIEPFKADIDRAIEEETKDERAIIREAEKQRDEVRTAVYDAVKGALLDQSAVTVEDAERWVEKTVRIDPKAIARLKRSKGPYPDEESLLVDLKEFYILVGGKLGPIQIVTTGTKRAHANRRTAEVAVDSDFTKKTLFHELGHHVEFSNGVVQLATTGFRKARTGGKGPVSLRKLAHMGYGNDEYAYPDNFFDPYVGKQYLDGTTEVCSMGLQQLADPDHILDIFEKDPEHLALVVGIAAQKDEATRAKLNYVVQIAEDTISTNSLRDEWEVELKRVATKQAMHKYLPGQRGEDEYPQIVPSIYGRRGANVYWMESLGKNVQIFYTIQDARNFLYLFLASEQGLLPEKMDNVYITNVIFNLKDIPSWFTSGMKLPKLEN